MKLRLLVIAVTIFIIANIYFDGRLLSRLKKLYMMMPIIDFTKQHIGHVANTDENRINPINYPISTNERKNLIFWTRICHNKN